MPMKNPAPSGPFRPLRLPGAAIFKRHRSRAEARRELQAAIQPRQRAFRHLAPEMAIRLDKAFGGDAETWHRLQTAYDFAQAMKRAD